MRTFRLPDLGEGLQEAELVEWRVQEGEIVSTDQPLAAVETAKAVVEIPAPWPGRVERLFAKAGDVVHVGAPLIAFEGGAEEDAGAVVGSVETGASVLTERPVSLGRAGLVAMKATPAVRALARKLSVDLSMVTPTGPESLVTAEDVQRVARILSETVPAEPLRGFRRAMAQNMALAQSEVASTTIMEDADVGLWDREEDVTIRLIRALAEGCAAEPGLNCWFESATLSRRLLGRIDLGVAVDTPDGLFVPVLRDVGAREKEDLRAGLDRLRADATARRVPPEELRGATITLSNFGSLTGRYASPVVLPPTVAILGAGRMRSEPVVRDDAVVVSRILPLSLTFDHRAVTGGEAARFLAAVLVDLTLAA